MPFKTSVRLIGTRSVLQVQFKYFLSDVQRRTALPLTSHFRTQIQSIYHSFVLLNIFLKIQTSSVAIFLIFAGDLDSIPRRKYVWYLTRSGSSLKRLYQAVKYFLSFNRGFFNNSDGQQRIQQQWTGDINLLFKTKYVSWKRLFANHLRATETPFTLAYRKGDPNKFFCFEIPWRQIISDDHIIWFDSEQENMMNLTRQWR